MPGMHKHHFVEGRHVKQCLNWDDMVVAMTAGRALLLIDLHKGVCPGKGPNLRNQGSRLYSEPDRSHSKGRTSSTL